MTAADTDALAEERTHLELAAACLHEMRASADHIADYGVDELASHSLGRMRAERIAALSADPDAPPFFGRIDRDSETSTHPGGGQPAGEAAQPVETFHIGRRHVRDTAGDPVVIDWRAPIATAFYRATGDDRMGVRRRRRFGFQHGRLTSYEDEQLIEGHALGLDSALLRAEIERPRVGPMRDIVATIQPDQDALVRADLDTSLCIQGAPGTGKTAVGLHRAAFLLYTYPDRLRRTGVLVVGPNAAFLHYIAQVLPSLGEVGIEQATVDDLVGVEPGTTPDPAELATLKGDGRLADVLRRALLTYIGKPSDDVVAIVGTRRFRIGAHHLRRYVDDARRALGDGLRWSVARERLRTQIAEDVRRQREDAGGAPSDSDTARVARSAAVREFVDTVWPAVTPEALLTRLYADADLLHRVSRTSLTDDERARLARPGRRPRWTPADAVLLDELRGLIDGVETFVHVVVDEAQDLSDMQCRAIARRCPLGSVTVLGDLAQATTAWAPGNWAETLDGLGHGGATVRALTAGYRVPADVLDVANRLLPHIAPTVPPATSVRAGVDDLRHGRELTLLDEVQRALAVAGSVGVIVPDARRADVHVALVAAGITVADDADAQAVSDEARVSIVAASTAKGLEFDSVVLLEPAAIVAAEPNATVGLRRLYVVLTRAVSRLAIVHDQPLPTELGLD